MRLSIKGLAVALVLFLLNPFNGLAQAPTNPLAPGYYIVVAAYRLGQDTYAQNYINRITKDGIKANYGADLKRKYLYVYLDYFTDFDTSIKEMLAARKKAGFEMAWVRIMNDELNTSVQPLTQQQTPSPTEPVNAVKQPESDATEPAAVVASEPELIAAPTENIASVAAEEEAKEELVADTPGNVEDPITDPKPVAEANVFLSLFNATNNSQVEGEVEVVDSDRARLINKVKGNEFTRIPDPKSKTGKVNLVANVFGFRPIQHDIYFGQVAHDSVNHFMEWAGNHYVIKFDLVRYHRGDIQTLYNVYFYNDAAIMLPESKYQLNKLLEMLIENPSYKIMLHGHTNGNSRGRIITMGPSQSFFSLADDVKDGTGSAKELSKERADVIRQWLMTQGIDAERIQIKAWGGGRMLHDKNSVHAKRNVRVDVEILEE